MSKGEPTVQDLLTSPFVLFTLRRFQAPNKDFPEGYYQFCSS